MFKLFGKIGSSTKFGHHQNVGNKFSIISTNYPSFMIGCHHHHHHHHHHRNQNFTSILILHHHNGPSNNKTASNLRFLSSIQQQTKLIHSDDESTTTTSATATAEDLLPKPSSSSSSAIIEYDEHRFRELSKEFSKSLDKNQLTNIENVWKDIQPSTISNVLNDYSKLAKIKLTGLVVLTTMAGFYMAIESSVNPTILASTLIGTALTSGSAAAWNHFLEVPFDSQMRRTQARPLVQGSLTPLHAATFATITGVAGLSILATYVNPLTALLGGINLCLYSFMYTPMKRVHIVNTWIGAIVGAIPPIMGFTAVNNFIDLPSLLLGLILYSWQFPHFNALSWNMRHEYARAGYRMMSVTNPRLCQQTALRHSTLLLGYTAAMCATDMTHWSFGIDSLPFSLYLVYLSYRFQREPSSQTSRKLFLYSLIYLPVIMLLMVISKNRKSSRNQERKKTN
ncbi:protoheme ix farnesyltransferase [Dermatophagoides farinae]|uniref:Protoheme IX farnesyltransferase, mitochondrial n=1 Tax=Dermatophagoides farinae TaxID=6954 RepID=A0A9D4SGC7_DERFA|nr:protoheme IX farnesyltransferase, mitochondrial-like [Dermatophagoides farinae]KAH7641394.1 protoheme ix farnesyltransferase [Dermatophagoides farinae]